MTASKLSGTRVWVVGASTGIGAALSRALVARGAQVAISARRSEALEEVAQGRMVVVPVDVTDRQAIAEAARHATAALGGLDTVIVNAGYWRQMPDTHWDADDFERHLDVNLRGLSNVLDAVLDDMVGAGRGQVVGIASVAGYRGMPGSQAYGATKAAQINLLESLRTAVARHGVRVVTVCPGFVRTDMTAGNRFPMPFMISAEAAARAICRGLERGRHEVIFPLPMAILMKLARFVPVGAWARIFGRTGR